MTKCVFALPNDTADSKALGQLHRQSSIEIPMGASLLIEVIILQLGHRPLLKRGGE